MSVILCDQPEGFKEKVEALAELLKTQAHLIPGQGLSEQDFYDSGLFRAAIERVRGQNSASMSVKREFARHVLNFLEDEKLISAWQPAGGSNRFDYSVTLNSGRIAAVELKGCLDGNNTNIFERPPQAHEFYIWSVCQNTGANPNRNVWSGIHTRLSAEIIAQEKQVDGLIVWDMVCGTLGRPCPKLIADPTRQTAVGPYKLPPPCVYLFPSTITSPRNNPTASPHSFDTLEFLKALCAGFRSAPSEAYSVTFEARLHGADLERRTQVALAGTVVQTSDWSPIRRS